MSLFSEHRLLHYTLDQINKQRATAGVKSLATSVGTTIRSAQENAAAQTPAPTYVVPSGTLGANTGAQFTNEELAQRAQEYYTQNGTSSPELDAYAANRQKPLQDALADFDLRQSTAAAAGAGLPADQVEAAKAAIVDQYKTQLEITQMKQQAEQQRAEGAANSSAMAQSMTQRAGGRFQGPSDSAPDRQTWIEQQRAAGKSDPEIRQMINTLPPEQTGGAQVASTSSTDAPQSTATPSAPSTATPKSDAPTGDKTTAQAAPVVDPSSAFLRNIAGTVQDPIMQAILLAEADRADAAAATNPDLTYGQFAGGADGQAIAKPYDAIDKILDRAYQTAQKTYASQDAFLKGQYDRNEKLNASKEANIQNQLAFARDKATRDQADANKKMLDSKTIMLALQGGFGSTDGNGEVAEARLKGEEALINLNKEFGFKATDVSLQFTEMHNQAFDNYQQAWLTATDNFETKVSNIDLQGISNQQAKSSALSGAYKDYVTEIKDARKEHAKIISDATKMVYDAVNTQRAQDFQKNQSVISQAQWAISTYGSGAKPFIEQLAKQNPGVDLAGLMGGQTLTEANQNFDNQLALMKEGRIAGGGGGGLSFPSYLQQPDGSPPTFESFLNEKEKQALNSGAVKFDTSAKAMAQYRKEYDTKLGATNQFNPGEIVNRFKMKAGLLSGPARKYAEGTLQEYLNAGQYQLASDFVDNTGDDVPATQSNDFTQALNARYSVNKMEGLFGEIGAVGPGIGQVRNLNPLDDRVVRFNQVLTQTIPGLARGIFREVGVLTDEDVKRYTDAIADPTLTVDQARNAFNDLKERVDISMKNQIQVWDANGKRVKGFNDLYEAQPTNTPAASPTLDASRDYANSILLGK